jgi:cytochrome c peroxidase
MTLKQLERQKSAQYPSGSARIRRPHSPEKCQRLEGMPRITRRPLAVHANRDQQRDIPDFSRPAALAGLGGPGLTDFKDRAEYCRLFKTPSLRNVELRRSIFHNGVFHTLREAVAF